MWVGWFIVCFSPNWEVRFLILELSWIVLLFLYYGSDFALKSPNAATKKGLLSKILFSFNSSLPVNVPKSSFGWFGGSIQSDKFTDFSRFSTQKHSFI